MVGFDKVEDFIDGYEAFVVASWGMLTDISSLMPFSVDVNCGMFWMGCVDDFIVSLCSHGRGG